MAQPSVPVAQVPDEGEVRKMMTGKATKLESQFRLTYSMILNLLRVEDLKVSRQLFLCCRLSYEHPSKRFTRPAACL